MSEEQSYDELYDKGFEEKDISISDTEPEEEQTEEPEDTLEQPTDEDDTEEPEGSLDEDTDEGTAVEEESDSNETEDEKYTITIGGQEVNLTIEEMKLFAQKGGDYTRKTQDLAKNRAEIEFMTENGLSHEDLVMLNDIKKGNKDAFAAVAKQAGIDPIDVEDDSSYVPTVKQVDYELKDTVDAIRNDSENGETIDRWISALPNSVKEAFASKPAILKGLHIDTVDGISKEIMPEVIKQMAINPDADFVQMYQSVGARIVSKETPKAEEKPKEVRETKKRASISKTKTTHLKDHQDVWEDDDLYKSMKKQLEAMK